MSVRRGLWLWVVLGCSLLLHGAFLTERAALERNNDTVELALDYEGVLRTAERTGTPARQLLTRWRALGVTSVAVGGTDDLDRTGPSQAAWVVDARAVGRIVPRTLSVARAAARFNVPAGAYVPRGEAVPGFPDAVGVTADTLSELSLPLGLIEFSNTAGAAEAARLTGYDVVFVHSIPRKELFRYTPRQAAARFHRAAFERQARLLYIHLPWDDDFAGAADAAGVQPTDGLGTEREDGEERLARYDEYIAAIVGRVQGAGLRVGPATSAPNWTTPIGLVLTAVVASGAALALVVGEAFPSLPVPARRLWDGVFVVGPVVLTACLFAIGKDVWARQGTALALALAFPVLGIGWAGRIVGAPGFGPVPVSGGTAGAPAREATGDRRHPVLYHPFGRALRALLVVVASGALGAALVAGALGDTRFMLKLQSFRGVKIAHIVPFVALALWAAANALFAGGRPLTGSRSLLDGIFARWRGARMTWRHVLIGVGVLAFGFVFVARTGHDLLPVSDAERALREWLETALPVRPRTKEILLGYPALIVGLALAASRRIPAAWRAWAAPLLIMGAIAPVSVINTFAHPHIALSVSIVRSGLGLLIGAFVGGAAAAAVIAFASGARRVWKGEHRRESSVGG